MNMLFLALLLACGGASEDPTDTEDSDTPSASGDTSSDTGTDTDDTGTDTDSDDSQVDSSDTATTGETGTTGFTEQAFAAPDERQVDVVLVVDNSCSMSDNQADLAGSMNGFVDILDNGDVDWHVGVTSTDIDALYGSPLQGRLVRQGGAIGVSSATPDPANTLGRQILLGVNGSGEEKGIGAAYLAAEVLRNTDNAGFFRDEASLHLVVLSDEEDQTPFGSPPVVSDIDFLDWLLDQRASAGSVSFSSIVCASPASCLPFDVGDRYIQASGAVGGVVWDIDAGIDLGAEAIADSIVTYAGLRFLALDEVPSDPATIEVLIDGVPLDAAEWTYDADANGVLMELPAPDGSDVVVRWPQ